MTQLIVSRTNNVPELPGVKLCCKKLDTCQDVKIFAISSFLERFVVKIANDYLC